MMTVYGVRRSRSTRALWALEEAGIPYDFKALNFQQGEHRQPAYLAINPGGKVPALKHGDKVLTESAAIVNYVAAQAGGGLIPADLKERADYDRWCFFALSELEQPLWSMGKHRFAIPEEYRIDAMLKTAAWEYQKALDLFAEGLGNQLYILGDQFSGADILLAQTLMWGNAFQQPLPQQNLQDYLQRSTEREALKRALATEDAATPGG